MDSLRFDIEWLDPEGVKAPELAATWARLQIWVGGTCLTQLETSKTTAARRSLFCSVYPLAEWVAYNWWFLQADTRAPVVSERRLLSALSNGSSKVWTRRHNLRSSGDGFFWPNLVIAPEGPYVQVEWK